MKRWHTDSRYNFPVKAVEIGWHACDVRIKNSIEFDIQSLPSVPLRSNQIGLDWKIYNFVWNFIRWTIFFLSHNLINIVAKMPSNEFIAIEHIWKSKSKRFRGQWKWSWTWDWKSSSHAISRQLAQCVDCASTAWQFNRLLWIRHSSFTEREIWMEYGIDWKVLCECDCLLLSAI